ncbi:MAG TPA: PQQ-dependent sugar dehydrogenase, partial [Candidatus Polarisedimenticolaceae bacterium]
MSRRIATLACLLTLVSLQAAELPEGFRLEPVLTSGLTEPSALDTTSDGRILIAERTTGNVRMVALGELQATPACSVAVNATGEGGLLGVVAHPRFAENGWIYLYYTAAATGRNKVTRFTVVPGSGCANGVDLLADLGAGPSFLRNGGGLAFGPDGKLYVATGDVENSSNAQNALSLSGKILRLEDTGAIPADNPTPGSAVWAKGVRDGKDVTVSAAGRVYATDAGSGNTIYDEINEVPANGNLGWDAATGNSNGAYDDPLASYQPLVGVRGVEVYGATAFPDLKADGIDNDHDRYGADLNPGVSRVDDNGSGECVGSANYGQPCTSNANCVPRTLENAYCEKRDESAEWCPGGVAVGDDGCAGAAGAKGVDEADESFRNVYLAQESANKIVRAVLRPTDDTTLDVAETFLDSNFLTDCPDNWTDVATGRDGWLYAVARNGGGAAGGLYRVIFDATPGPREVSAPGSHFPVRIDKGTLANEVVVTFEDLRSDATQPRDDGNADPALRLPQPPVREFQIWQGNLGTWYSHAVVSGQDKAVGTVLNEAARKVTVNAGTGNSYFLVSARSANLEGTLGKRTDGTPRPGFATTDLCSIIGYHQSTSYDLWKCGQDFTLKDEHGVTRSLYSYRGSPVMLDFSAIWCAPCQAEADVLENLHRDFQNRGVRVLTVLA